MTVGPQVFIEYSQFFDRTAVIARITRKERRVLGRSGAFGRRTIRNMIRRRKSISSPGNPPHAHVSGNTGLKLVLFGYSASRQSVAIGHLKFNTQKSQYTRRERSSGRAGRDKVSGRFVPRGPGPRVQITRKASKPIPALLNSGGTTRLTKKYLTSGKTYNRVLNYQPRPFRDLAFPIVNQKFRQLMAEEDL